MDNEDDGYDDQFDDELDDDDEAPKKKKRVATSTKIVLIVAGWILLTLFLVGEFSRNKNNPDTANAELQTTTGEFDDGGTPDIVDTEAEAEFDLDGDGFLDESERSAALEAFEASVEAGEVAIGESDVSESEGGGSGDGTYPGPDGETATPAVPGAAPSSGSGSSTTTTAKPSGGGGSPTTTAAPATTKPGNAPTTTASPTTTSPTPTTAPPAPTAGPPQTIEITKSGSDYIYTPRNFTVSPGTQVNMFNNSNALHNWKVGNATPEVLAKGFKTEYRTINATVDYRCTIHDELTGRITVE